MGDGLRETNVSDGSYNVVGVLFWIQDSKNSDLGRCLTHPWSKLPRNRIQSCNRSVASVNDGRCRFIHCKNIRTSTDILQRVFHILTAPLPYTFVSVNRRNNEARAHTRHKISVNIRIFLQCRRHKLQSISSTILM